MHISETIWNYVSFCSFSPLDRPWEKSRMTNNTRITEVILMGFSDVLELQTVCGLLFLVMYLGVIMSNFLIITLITLDLKLKSPMYFFLKNLSLFDILLVSIPIPKFIINSLTHNNYISIVGCAFQILLMTSFQQERYLY